MQHINERQLETDVGYRFQYLTEFMGLGAADIAAIHDSAPLLAPLVPTLVDAVYVKLFNYDATKRHFVPRQTGYEGEVPTSLADLTLDHELIKFRKGHLGRYLAALVHTPLAGSKDLSVPLVQMNALMGFVSDALISTIFSLGLGPDKTAQTVRAFNKLLWVQNDLITRHYQGLPQTQSAA